MVCVCATEVNKARILGRHPARLGANGRNPTVVNVLLPHGRSGSDFSTLVPPAGSPYNPTKNRTLQRSSGEACAEGSGISRTAI